MSSMLLYFTDLFYLQPCPLLQSLSYLDKTRNRFAVKKNQFKRYLVKHNMTKNVSLTQKVPCQLLLCWLLQGCFQYLNLMSIYLQIVARGLAKLFYCSKDAANQKKDEKHWVTHKAFA